MGNVSLFLKLLDIRIGRANRMQAFIFAIVLFGLSQLISFFMQDTIASRPELASLDQVSDANLKDICVFLTSELIINYLLLVLVVRRVRDINYKPLIPAVLAIIVLLFNSLMYSWELFGDDSYTAGYGAAGVVGFVVLPIVSLSGLAMVVLLISPGTEGINRYGPEPQGLDFRTMVRETTEQDLQAFKKKEDNYEEVLAPWRKKRRKNG